MAENLKKFMHEKLNSGLVYPAAVLQGRKDSYDTCPRDSVTLQRPRPTVNNSLRHLEL